MLRRWVGLVIISSYITSQVSLCTSDGGATACYIVSYLIDLVITLKTDYLEIIG